MSRLGYLAVSAAAILWAAGATVAGRLFDRGASPIELTAARAWISVLGIGAIALARRPPEGPRPRIHPALIVLFGAALTTANATYYLAISRLPVAIAIVIQYTAPAVVVVWTAVAARRAPGARVVAALIAVLAGVVLLAELPGLLTGGGLSVDALGLVAASASSLAFAAYIIVGERMTIALGPVRSLALAFAIASVFWGVLIAARGGPTTLLDASFIGPIAFLGVGTTIAPFLLFLWGLGYVGASRAGIVSTLEPVAAALFALVWLDQALAVQQLAGAAIVVIAIGALQAERPAEVAPPG